MRFAVLLVAISLSSCASTKLPNTRTAAEQFSALGAREKAVARNFYDLGSGDAIRRLYWAQRASQQYKGTAGAQPTTNLQRKYVVLPVPEHLEPDGTIKEATNEIVEVVQ